MAFTPHAAAAPDAAPDNGMIARRQRAMALCADAKRTDLEEILDVLRYEGAVEDLRRPETGLVMVRGQIGGDGAPFNFGEATVIRAAVRLDGGEVGFAYQLGRDAQKARMAAIIDALLQSPRHSRVTEDALKPIELRLAGERAVRERQTAATRVNFFTMVRGED
ncbi:phosphonate C-P lyase system protein PhnG [Microvirga guangxiensis]|uniref:Alpha-D-ribose 1-methylphosphonate 5-triphosphate synthase subunit PhnG n=1 Tax=Microvirga guangxiensis TaxID=549386 RepID=A0A1G5KF26_9HYPH|nr:phosphonate C-P lyase system protein PhnG [Microvirga guangxiensis]SCY99245.1 alpha-D-ribose 1-methylphosphonate 5-triphosphate synthase subunit PhnG [Microvirga guangxiensis]